MTSKEIQAQTGLSQASISRQINALGDAIVKMGSGRSTSYALTKNAFGVGNNIPLYMIDPHGSPICVAEIRPLAHGGYFLEHTTGTPSVLLGEKGNGLFDGLPYFLSDLRPQGFIGRSIAKNLSGNLNFPPDPRQWSEDQVGSYLLAYNDLPGNLIIGQQNFMRLPHRVTPLDRDQYLEVAERTMQGEQSGSSVGGEQPKFTAYTERRGHVLVKFSPPGNDRFAQRWRDVLLTEYHAHKILRESLPVPLAVDSQIVEIGNRLFIESSRFDRSGMLGRLPMLSLSVIDAEFVGEGTNWPRVMKALAQQNRIAGEHYADSVLLYEFGRAINNTDMHLGNLSLEYDGNVFRLLPVYDMCSMGFAPTANGVGDYSFEYVDTSADMDVKTKKFALDLAIKFWKSLAQDSRISDEMREYLRKGIPTKT